MDKFIGVIVFVSLLSFSSALECYVCAEQDSNKDKCVKSTLQCEQRDDTCTTIIKWQVPPYWTPRGDYRLPYITKTCDTKASCDAKYDNYRRNCKRDWYNDWTCVECCQGDLCNYYVTLGSGSVRSNLMMALMVLVPIAVWQYLQG